jgi:hypothetical protein
MESHGPKWHPLYVIKPWRSGPHFVLPIYLPVLRMLGFDLLNPQELFIVRVHPPYMSIRVAHPPKVFPLTDVDLAALPPAWPAPSAKDPNR